MSRWLRADMERAFIDAYYRHVVGCEDVTLDLHDQGRSRFVAIAWSGNSLYGMDFSSRYEFPTGMRPATIQRNLEGQRQRLHHHAAVCADLASDPFEPGAASAPFRAIYEIWCFVPPSQKLLEAVRAAPHGDVEVVLVSPEDIDTRVRQTVLAVPEQDAGAVEDGRGDDEDADDVRRDNAFVVAARIFRRAFGVSGASGGRPTR